MKWTVVHTKPREEKRAKTNLENLGFKTYIPYLKVETIKGGKILIAQQPLFPRYVFVAQCESVYAKYLSKLRNVRGVSGIVSFNGTPATISEEELAAVRTVENELKDHPKPKFLKGERLRFSYGAFKNIEAIFLEKSGDERVLLMFEMLEQKTKMVVPTKVVSKI